jgi:hypothetical protein
MLKPSLRIMHTMERHLRLACPKVARDRALWGSAVRKAVAGRALVHFFP